MFAMDWQQLRRWAFVGSVAILLAAGWAYGEDPNDREVQDLTSRLKVQEQQLEQLTRQIEARQQTVAGHLEASTSGKPLSEDDKIRKLAESVFAEKEEQKRYLAEQKRCDDAAQGYEVGTLLGLSAHWGRPNRESGLVLESAHKDFEFHLGGRFQTDDVWWNQDAALRKPPAAGGIGPLEDGTFFRRVRLQMDGTLWETMIFNMEYSFETWGNNIGTAAMEEFYAGMKNLPWLGEVRIGQVRIPQGLDPNFTGSNKAGTFLEPAGMCDAFFNNLGVGIWLGNQTCDSRLHWFAMAYRQEGGSISSGDKLQGGATDGAAIGDGNFAYTARIVGLPCYMYEGRELVQVGFSGTYRCALPDSTTAPSSPNFVDFSARPQMRDTIGNYTNVGPGNSTRFVSTGPLQASDATVLDAELLWIHGPLYVQSEWALAYASSAIGQKGTPLAGRNLGNVGFNGGYVQVSYILTGEHRLYDLEHARLNSLYLKPNTPFFLVRNGAGNICSGWGAWEIAARYSYLNLNDGDVQGGIMAGESVELNWYLNSHVRVLFDFEHANRYDLGASAIIGGVGFTPGAVNSFGVRTQIVF